MTISLETLDAATAAAMMERGELTAERLVRALLDRIDLREPVVLAWEHVDAEGALAAARRLDREVRSGPLHGIPLGVKDVIDTADQPTGYGSPIYRGHRPQADAACIAVTRRAGGIVLGKTVTAEFAHRLPGVTRNPHDPTRTPGGSSSGSAAAVADYMVPLALGTQTTASTTRPASYCGVVGYRPTYGTMPCMGVKAQAPSFDTLGIFSRTLQDAALYRDVLLERPVRLPSADAGGPLRIGFCRTPFWSSVEPDTAAALEGAAARLARAGAHLVVAPLTRQMEGAAEAHRIISSYELARSLTVERLERPDGLSEVLKAGKMAEGLTITAEAFAAAVETLEQIRCGFGAFMGELDIVMAPSAAGIAGVGLESTGPAHFSSIWTALHLPSISVPLPERIAGLPVGVQLLGRRGDDVALFDAASWVARHLG